MVRIESSGCYNGWPAANSWFIIQVYWMKSGCRSQTNIAVGNSSIWKVKRRSYLRYSRADSFSLSDSNNNKFDLIIISPVHRSVGEPAEGSLTRIQHVYPPPWSLVHSPPCSSRMNRKVRPYLEESHHMILFANDCSCCSRPFISIWSSNHDNFHPLLRVDFPVFLFLFERTKEQTI